MNGVSEVETDAVPMATSDGCDDTGAVVQKFVPQAEGETTPERSCKSSPQKQVCCSSFTATYQRSDATDTITMLLERGIPVPQIVLSDPSFGL